jgi:hypothetical protein
VEKDGVNGFVVVAIDIHLSEALHRVLDLTSLAPEMRAILFPRMRSIKRLNISVLSATHHKNGPRVMQMVAACWVVFLLSL